MRTVIVCTMVFGLAAAACGGADAEGGARRHDPNRQPRIEQPTDDTPPPNPKDMPGKGRGSETKWDRKLNH